MSSAIKKITFFAILFFSLNQGNAQSAQSATFIDYQKSFPKITDVMKRKQDTLMKQFAAQGLKWPAAQMYLRSFKYDSQLEVWVRYAMNEPFKLFKTYKVCALSGSMGPKRMQGDYQVPEGFYYINEFNPRSSYHLSLGLNYPNASDRILSDTYHPGGDIYIHGSCVTTGCIPIMDNQIEELYILAAFAKSEGQDFIPVHIFPIRFTNENSKTYLNKYLQTFNEYNPFVEKLREVYFYFEKHKKLPVIAVGDNGEYITSVKPDDIKVPEKPQPKKYVPKTRKHIPFDETKIPASVNKLPVFPGGTEAFQAFLNKMSGDLGKQLDEKQHTAYVLVEFIVTEEGKLINPVIVRGGNPELNDGILDRFEALPNWEPAIRQDLKVPMKLKQTVVIEKK